MGLVSRLMRPISSRVRRHPTLARMTLACVPDLRVRANVPLVGPFYIKIKTNRSYWLRNPLDLELFPLGALRAMARPDDVAWDIGGNIGLYSRFLCGECGVGRVAAFEPMARNREQLRANLELGRCADRVRVLPFALADVEREDDLQIDDVQSATAVLSQVTGGQASEGRAAVGLGPRVERVAVRTIDGLIERGEAPAPTLVKIDVEGAEAAVLRGAERLLRRDGVRLQIELHGADATRETVQLLLDAGYRVRGPVKPHIDSAGYIDIDRPVLGRLKGHYDLRYIVAARNPEDLPTTNPALRKNNLTDQPGRVVAESSAPA